MQFETLEQLIKKRKGYKFLNKDYSSPYQEFQYDRRKRIFKTNDLNENLNEDCGAGFNLATIEWILINSFNLLDQIIVEYSIPADAKIIVPNESTGKFRTNIIKKEKVYHIGDFVPELKYIKKKIKRYKPINPITAIKLPSKRKIKNILRKVWDQVRDQVGAQIGDQVWDQVWDQVRAQVWAQIGDQIGAQVWAQTGDQIGAQIGAQVRDQVGAQIGAQIGAQAWAQARDQVGAQIGDQIWDQVWDQVRVIAYYTIKEFLNLDYDHPAFDLIKLGVSVVKISDKFKVFGKNGQFLGEFEEDE